MTAGLPSAGRGVEVDLVEGGDGRMASAWVAPAWVASAWVALVRVVLGWVAVDPDGAPAGGGRSVEFLGGVAEEEHVGGGVSDGAQCGAVGVGPAFAASV